MAAIVNNANINQVSLGSDAHSKAGVTTYTDGTRPAASALFAKLAYNSTQGKHQISDGLAWYTFLLDWPYASPQPLASYTTAARPAAASNTALVIRNSTTGQIERSDGSNWIALGATLDEAAESILQVGPDAVAGQAAPARITPPTNATKLYYDPVSGNNGNAGTFASPKQTLPGTLAAGTEYLIKAGTTVTGLVSMTVDGSSGSRAILGVYNAATGARVSTLAAATLSGGVSITGDWSVIDGFDITGGSDRISLLNVANVTILNCRTNGAGSCGVNGYNASNVTMDGCEARLNADRGVKFGTPSGTVCSGMQIQYCNLSDNLANAGFAWYGETDSSILATSEIVKCDISRNDNRSGGADADAFNAAGIATNGAIRSLRIYRNTFIRNCYASIRCFGYLPQPEPCDALIIENNYMLGSSMSIHLTNMQGKWKILRNKIVDAGTNADDKSTLANPRAAYGRAIELFCVPKEESKRTSGGVIAMNALYGAVAWDQWMTEGIGLGLDDWTGYVTCFGNWVAHNEGSGVQYNTNRGSVCLGNVFYDNCRRPLANRVPLGNVPAFAMRSEVGGSNQDCLTVGNVMVAHRELESGQGGMSDYGSSGFEWSNNLVVNARVGMNSNGSLHEYNRYRGCVTSVASAYSDFVPATGTPPLSTGEVVESSSAGVTSAAHAAECAYTMLMALPYSGTVSGGGGGGGGGGGATYGEAHGGALSDPNTSFIDVDVTYTGTVPTGGSLHLVGAVWSIAQATNRVTGLPTTAGETWQLATSTAPLGEIESYVWVIPQMASGGAGKTARVRVTRQDNSFWSFYLFPGPALDSTPVDVAKPLSQSGTTYTVTGDTNTTVSTFAVGFALHNHFLQTGGTTFGVDTNWSEVARRANVSPYLSSFAFTRSIGASSAVSMVTTASVAPASWWHGGVVAYQLVAGGAPSITTGETLPEATLNSAYTQTLVASGATPITWALTSGALPPGVGLSTTGVISGTPTAIGTYSATITATNGSGSNARTFSLVVASPSTSAPPAPSGLVVTTLSPTSLRLQWTSNSTTQTSFEIRRKAESGGVATEIGYVPGVVTTVDIEGLTPFTRYFFDVRAYLPPPGTSSAFSNEASATTEPRPDDPEWVRLPRGSEVWVRVPRDDA